jgi:hypothetical protein
MRDQLPLPGRRALLGSGTILLGAALAGCVAAVPNPYPPIPPLREEVPPPRRGAEEVFVPGHWHWNGRDYEWIAGHWTAQPAGMARFVPGRWVARHGAWEWIPAHWDR